MTAYEEAKSRYQIRTPFIFDEIDYRISQSEKKLAAVKEYEAAIIDPDTTRRILVYAAIILATALGIERAVRKRPPEEVKIPQIPVAKRMLAEGKR